MIMYDWVCSMGHVVEAMGPMGENTRACDHCAVGFTDRVEAVYSKASLEIAQRKSHKLMLEEGVDNFPSCVAHRILLATPSWHQKDANSLKMVVHRDPQTGEYRHPGHRDAPVTVGYEKVEVLDMHHARRIEREINAKELVKENDNLCASREHFEKQRSAGEADIRAKMADFTPQGRAFAELSFTKNRIRREEQRTSGQGANAGFEALSYDKTNRQEHRDEKSNWNKVQE